METNKMIIFVFLFVTNFVQGLVAIPLQEHEINRQLMSINKQPITSFETEHGDILDCIDIHKQLAFDHPLLRNHTIQMRPNFDISKFVKSSSTDYQILPRNMRCPKGTVMVRRTQKEDLLDMNVSKFRAGPGISNARNSVYNSEANTALGHQVSLLSTWTKSTGVTGNLNIWGPEVGANQLSAALIYAASDDGATQNYITSGWSVNSYLYPNSNSTRLHVFWTKDSGATTGCYNLLCPGFVQVSQQYAPGAVLTPLSKVRGVQYFITPTIRQDKSSGNWWVFVQGKQVGYYPEDLFTTLKGGADAVGWGGEVASPTTQPFPAMGTGNVPDTGFGNACYICQMHVFDINGQEFPVSGKNIQGYNSKESCYQAKFVGDAKGLTGPCMLLGGPPDCQN